MRNPIEVSRVRSGVTPAPADSAGRSAGAPKPSSNGPRQVSPARSAAELAARALSVSRRQQEVFAASRSAHFAKLHALLRGDRRNDALLARALVGRIAKASLAAQDSKLEQLLLEFADADEVDDLLLRLDKAELNPSAMALVLAAMAEQHRPGRKRSRLEQALDHLLASGQDWQLSMLGWLEFGAELTPELMTQMKSLYQHCASVGQGMAVFFARLAGMGKRRRKLKVLIRALGAELGGVDDDPAEGVRLLAVVRDLKRLLIFLGFEEQCVRIAHALGEPAVEPDAILHYLLEIIDQSWLYPEWLGGAAETLHLSEERALKLIRELGRLCKALPDPCFRDDEHRQQVLEAIRVFNARAEGDEC